MPAAGQAGYQPPLQLCNNSSIHRRSDPWLPCHLPERPWKSGVSFKLEARTECSTHPAADPVNAGVHLMHFTSNVWHRYLSFEDHRGGLQTVNVKTLKELCCTNDDSTRELQLVFVSACYSRVTGQAFIDAGIKHVCCVNVEAKILDKAAISFQYVADRLDLCARVISRFCMCSPSMIHTAHHVLLGCWR